MKKAKKIVALVSLSTLVFGMSMNVFGATKVTEKAYYLNSVSVGTYPSVGDATVDAKILSAYNRVFYDNLNTPITNNANIVAANGQAGYVYFNQEFDKAEDAVKLELVVKSNNFEKNDKTILTLYYDQKTKKEITEDEYKKAVEAKAAADKKAADEKKAAADKAAADKKAKEAAAKLEVELAEASKIGEAKRLTEAKESAAAYDKATTAQMVRDYSIGKAFMVPLSNPLTELAGYDVIVIGNSATLRKGYNYFSVKLNVNEYHVGNGEYMQLEYPPVMVNDKVYVPYSFFEKVMGVKATFNSNGTIKEITGLDKFMK